MPAFPNSSPVIPTTSCAPRLLWHGIASNSRPSTPGHDRSSSPPSSATAPLSVPASARPCEACGASAAAPPLPDDVLQFFHPLGENHRPALPDPHIVPVGHPQRSVGCENRPLVPFLHRPSRAHRHHGFQGHQRSRPPGCVRVRPLAVV